MVVFQLWSSSKDGSNGESRRRSEFGDGIERNGGWGIQLAMKQKCHEKCSYHNFSMDLSMRHFMGQNVGEYKLGTDEALIGAADGAS